MMKEITGGVCAATGFTASGLRCGVKANARPDRKDLALIYSEKPCSAAGMFTTNQVKASCVAAFHAPCGKRPGPGRRGQ